MSEKQNAGKTTPLARVHRDTAALRIACATCDAAVGERCKSRGGRQRASVHVERFADATPYTARQNYHCRRCPEHEAKPASSRSSHLRLPPLCEDHASAFLRGVAWHMLIAEETTAQERMQTLSCGNSAILDHARVKETQTRVWRLYSKEPFMLRLRAAGALPSLETPVLQTEPRVFWHGYRKPNWITRRAEETLRYLGLT